MECFRTQFWLAAGHLHLIPLSHSSSTYLTSSQRLQKAFDADIDPPHISFSADDSKETDLGETTEEGGGLNVEDAVRIMRRDLREAKVKGKGTFWVGDKVEGDAWDRING